MKRIILSLVLLVSVVCYGQDKLPGIQDTITLKEGTQVHRSATRYSSKTYTEIYDVVTDSVVYHFGMEFRYSDSTFVRKVPMGQTPRELYDRMQAETDFILRNQEQMRKETVEFIDRFRTSYEVWRYFKLLGIFGR